MQGFEQRANFYRGNEVTTLLMGLVQVRQGAVLVPQSRVSDGQAKGRNILVARAILQADKNLSSFGLISARGIGKQTFTGAFISPTRQIDGLAQISRGFFVHVFP